MLSELSWVLLLHVDMLWFWIDKCISICKYISSLLCQTLDNLRSTIFWHPISQNGWIHFKVNYPILDHCGVLLVYTICIPFFHSHVQAQYFTWIAYSWKYNLKVGHWHISFLKLNYSILENYGVLIWLYLDPIFQFIFSNHILTNILTKPLYLGIVIFKCTFEKSKILERNNQTCVLKMKFIFYQHCF
jgi:hypothetical protein